MPCLAKGAASGELGKAWSRTVQNTRPCASLAVGRCGRIDGESRFTVEHVQPCNAAVSRDHVSQKSHHNPNFGSAISFMNPVSIESMRCTPVRKLLGAMDERGRGQTASSLEPLNSPKVCGCQRTSGDVVGRDGFESAKQIPDSLRIPPISIAAQNPLTPINTHVN